MLVQMHGLGSVVRRLMDPLVEPTQSTAYLWCLQHGVCWWTLQHVGGCVDEGLVHLWMEKNTVALHQAKLEGCGGPGRRKTAQACTLVMCYALHSLVFWHLWQASCMALAECAFCACTAQ
jgi:hypothetical protein